MAKAAQVPTGVVQELEAEVVKMVEETKASNSTETTKPPLYSRSPWYMQLLSIAGLLGLLYTQVYAPRPMEFRLAAMFAAVFTVIILPDLADNIESVVRSWFGGRNTKSSKGE